MNIKEKMNLESYLIHSARKDELGILFESFKGMREKLTEIISKVNDSSQKITYAAQELSN